MINKNYFETLLINKYKERKEKLANILKSFPNGKLLKEILTEMNLSERELREALINTAKYNPKIDIFPKEKEGKEEQWIKVET